MTAVSRCAVGWSVFLQRLRARVVHCRGENVQHETPGPLFLIHLYCPSFLTGAALRKVALRYLTGTPWRGIIPLIDHLSTDR